ncbi:MAG TPA: GGDEF domain-containing protein [Desulfovibrio sp.]|uniref:GGDEF domain-containing protein n=1 Tax=Desulfovibrio sp. TaxID=885 RepID=UPI002C381CA9|nr:GGDEF domain-containing protein [Desulfovibrio sp.]HMM38741.1 GGDEF domain-containing protein [Desulfovibrio sp.]
MERFFTLRYAALLGFIALLAALAFWNIRTLSTLHQESVYFIDLSARQMALAQRLAADAARLDLAAGQEQRGLLAENLRKNTEFMANSHDMLTGEATRLPDIYRSSEALRAVYHKPPLFLDQQVRRYLQTVRELLEEPDPARRASLRDSLLLAARERLPEALRQAARLYRDEAHERAELLRTLGLGILALTLGLLLLELFLIFRPLSRRVSEADRNLTELARKMEEASRTDSLTCLPNRACMNEILERELSAARRYGNALSILLLDIDHFSRFNTIYGLESGDRLLAEVALLLKNNLRLTDHVFRYEGEAFAVVATQTPVDGALALAEKLRRVIKGCAFGSQPLTLSLGITAVAAQDDRENLLRRATQALKRAKDNGRDRAEVEPSPA